MEKMELAHKEEAHKGRAYILTCVNSNTISSFEVEIKECLNQTKEEEKGLKLKITDSKLHSRRNSSRNEWLANYTGW